MYDATKFGIDRECLVVHGNRLVEAPQLHEQFGIRVIRVGVVGDELDVFLERGLGLAVLPEEPVGVPHLVVRLREACVDLGSLHEVVDRTLVLLPPEVGVREQRLRALVLRKERHELRVVAQHASRIVLEPGIEREHHVPFAFADLRREGDRLGHGLDELAIRARRGREPDVCEREAGVLRRGLLVEAPRISRAEPFGEVAALQVQSSCFFGRRRDRDLSCRCGGLRARGRADGADHEQGKDDAGSVKPSIKPCATHLVYLLKSSVTWRLQRGGHAQQINGSNTSVAGTRSGVTGRVSPPARSR